MMKKTLSILLMALVVVSLARTFVSCGGDDGGGGEEGPQLSLSPTSVDLDATGSNQITIAVTSNTSWNVSKDANASWLTIGASNGSKNGSFNIWAEDNKTGSDRSATITVQVTRGSVYKTVTVRQAAGTPPSNPTLTVNVKDINFENSGGSQEFSISSNVQWTVTSNASWCTVSPTSGSNNGKVVVKASENATNDNRTAIITVSGGGISTTVNVSQGHKAPDSYLTVDKDKITFSSSSGSNTVSISSNVQWTVTSDASWCTVSPTSGSNNGTVIITVSENTSSNDRTASITVSGGGITKTTTITQGHKAPDPYLNVDKNSLSFSSSSDSNTFSISSNVQWTVTSSASWCTVSPTSGTNNGSITVNVTNNPNSSSRSATITINGGSITRTITVNQAEKTPDPYLTVDKNNISFSSSSGSNTFFISSNVQWTVTSSASWCTVSPSSGSNDKTITVNVTNNSNSSSRSATITVKGGSFTRTITVSQAEKDPDPYLTVDKSSLSFSSSSGSNTFAISSNVQWTVTSSASWCTVSPTSGSNDKTITVNVTNNPNSSSRSATITISGGSFTRTITVIQDEKPVDYTLTVSPSSLTFKADGETQNISVTSNDSWSVSSNQSWCTLSVTSGSNNVTVKVTASKNPTTSSRSAIITFYGSKSGISRSVSVTQKALSGIPGEDDNPLPQHTRRR